AGRTAPTPKGLFHQAPPTRTTTPKGLLLEAQGWSAAQTLGTWPDGPRLPRRGCFTRRHLAFHRGADSIRSKAACNAKGDCPSRPGKTPGFLAREGLSPFALHQREPSHVRRTG